MEKRLRWLYFWVPVVMGGLELAACDTSLAGVTSRRSRSTHDTRSAPEAASGLRRCPGLSPTKCSRPLSWGRVPARADMRARSEAGRASLRARPVRHPSRCRLQIILANRAVEIDSLDDVIRDRSCILVDQNAGSGNSCGMHSREDVCCWQPAKTA